MNLRFPGQYWDEETQTHYNFHRDYMPRLGRYVQSDPIGLKGGINMFAYAKSNSIANLDSVGLKAQVCCRIIVGAIKAAPCFVNEVQDDNEEDCKNCRSQNRTLGLQEPPPIGTSKNGHGEKTQTDNFNDPAQSVCGPWTSKCDLSKCLTNQFETYTNPSRYSAFGPNSNTFAYTLASRCGISPPPNQPWSPGWGQSPAGPPITGNAYD